jgi:hypothetical protein
MTEAIAGAARARFHRSCDSIRRLWTRHRHALLTAAIVLTAISAALRMYTAIAILIDGSSPSDVVSFFADLVPRWFAGLPVYSYSEFAVHLPATYALLWPIFGILSSAAARWVWIALLLAALARIIYIAQRESGAATAAERGFIALMPLSAYGVLFTVRAGQFGIFVLALLMGGLFLLARSAPSWRRDGVAALCLLLTLVKPTVAAPFIWLALFLPGGFRTVLLVGLAYLALTLLALSFQPDDFVTLFRDWQARSAALATSEGTANLHRWFSHLGLAQWILPASLATLFAFGAWVYRNRGSDLWLLIGVTAIVARFWTYHRPYDDLLMLLPAIALFRLAKRARGDTAVDVIAGALLIVVVATSLTPIRFVTSSKFQPFMSNALAVIWCATLVFLARQAHHAHRRVAEDQRRELPTESMA